MADNTVAKVRKQLIREEILNRWDIKIPASRAAKLTVAQLEGIRNILQKD